MLKSLTAEQVRTIANQLSTCYEESLIDLALTLVMQDPQAADYLQSQLRNALQDQDLVNALEDLDYDDLA